MPHPDPKAIEIAHTVQTAVRHSTVILFGSRASGSHRDDSDVDLMLIYHNKSPVSDISRAQRAVNQHFTNNPPPLKVEFTPIGISEFNYCRRAKNHVAGQASRKGIIMSRERLDFSYNYEDDYPENWPDVKWRLQATYRNLGRFQREFDHPEGEQENYCFHAQQAVENSLKAWISAANLDYSGVHNLDSIADSIFNDDTESNTLAAQQLRILLDYVTVEDPEEPDEKINWLTLYGAWYRYQGTEHRMTEPEKQSFRQEIVLATYTFINRAQELTNTTDQDLRS